MPARFRLSVLRALSIAAALFFAGSTTLVVVSFRYAAATQARGRNQVIAFSLLGTTVAVMVAGAILLWIGWRAAQANDSARKELESQTEALRESERRHRATFEEAVVGLVRITKDGVIEAANPALARMLGYERAEDLLGQEITSLYVDAEDRRRMMADLGDQVALSGLQWQWKGSDGRHICVRVTSRVIRGADGTPQEFEDIVEDVTDRVVLGEQLRHAQRMEAVGRLAGGVAHDFNNLLMVMLGHAELLLDERLTPSATENVEQIRRAATSATALTRQLLMFSRKGVHRPEPVNLNEAVSHAHSLITRLIGEDIRVRCDLDPTCGCVLVDRGQMEQALINLAVNARDAMPQGGTLAFETSSLATSKRVRVVVRDTGHGMSLSLQQRIFDPFFTTKEPGKGTGLGLAMVYSFVQTVGGEIRVSSAVGRGTAMILEFPAVAAPAATSVTARHPETRPMDHTARVLVVEDQEAVRSLVARVLRSHGFDVRQAADAAEARSILMTDDAVDLVLSDVVMPGESGVALAEWIRATRPDVRVALMSGFNDHPVTHTLNEDAVLQKPFTQARLLEHVRERLDLASGLDAPVDRVS